MSAVASSSSSSAAAAPLSFLSAKETPPPVRSDHKELNRRVRRLETKINQLSTLKTLRLSHEELEKKCSQILQTALDHIENNSYPNARHVLSAIKGEYDLRFLTPRLAYEVYFALGVSLWKTRNIKNAIKEFKRAITFAPTNHNAYNALFILIIETKTFDQIDVIKQLSEKNGCDQEEVQFRYLIAQAYRFQDTDLEKAKQFHEKAGKSWHRFERLSWNQGDYGMKNMDDKIGFVEDVRIFIGMERKLGFVSDSSECDSEE